MQTIITNAFALLFFLPTIGVAMELKTFESNYLSFKYPSTWIASPMGVGADLGAREPSEGKNLQVLELSFGFASTDRVTEKELRGIVFMQLETIQEVSKKSITSLGTLKGNGLEITGFQNTEDGKVKVKVISFSTVVTPPKSFPNLKAFVVFGGYVEEFNGKPLKTDVGKELGTVFSSLKIRQ